MMVPEDRELAWRDLELQDIPLLAGFAPEEWHMNLDQVLLAHFGREYSCPRVAASGMSVVAVGQGIATGRTGWIGNVIVRPEDRGRGIGSRMTQEIISSLRSRGCSSLLLIATAAGEPVYARLGFRRTADYVFLDVPRLPPFVTPAIRRLRPEDWSGLAGLDARATGEARTDLLRPHFGTGWGHVEADGRLDGFFLPSFGAGLVIGESPAAGLDLLRFKHAFVPGKAVVPATNTAALQFLDALGARRTATAPRMALGGDAAWRPDCVYARGAGYCG